MTGRKEELLDQTHVDIVRLRDCSSGREWSFVMSDDSLKRSVEFNKECR